MTEKTDSTAASARPKRIPLHNRNVLDVKDQDPNYSYRYVNANLERQPDRIQRFIDAGWEVVPQKKAGQLGDKRVDSPSAPGSATEVSVGLGTKAILMRIPKEYKMEDDAAKQAELDKLEGTMHAPADYGDIERRPANSKI
jgi:hypothetical protein